MSQVGRSPGNPQRSEWFDVLLRRLGVKEHQLRVARAALAAILVGALLLLVDDLFADGATLRWFGRPGQSSPGGAPKNARGVIAPAALDARGEARSGLAGGDGRDALPPHDLLAWERQLNRDLSLLLGGVEGAGRVQVWVRLRSSPEQTVAQNTTRSTRTTSERDREGVNRQVTEESANAQPVMGRSGEAAVLRRVEAPAVDSVTVVADGGRYPAVRERLLQAVQGALGVPPHRVQIVPGEGS